MGELFGIVADRQLQWSVHFREDGHPRGYREEGWGVAALQGPAALTIKEAASRPDPATAAMLREGRALRGEAAIAYIRRWTHSASLANSHPFVRELGGREWAFAHNGNVADLMHAPGWEPARFRPVGSTDSEFAFCALLDRLAAARAGGAEAVPGPSSDGARALAELLGPLSQSIARHGMFNYLLATERCLVVFSSGEYGLYVLEMASVPTPMVLADEDWEMEIRGEGSLGPCIIAASNPMTDGPWQRMEGGEIIVAVDGRLAARRPPVAVVLRGRRPRRGQGAAP